MIVRISVCAFNHVGALDEFDNLAKKLYDASLSGQAVNKIKLEMSRNLNLMMSNRSETLAEATRLYETVVYLCF